MLFDLIRALPAALFVGLLPGWFWSKLMIPTGSLAERVAFSVALSITLVPAVALVPASIFGTGVTLAVAVASALVVFVLGLALRRRFGDAKGDDGPVVPAPAPLGVPALALLVPAFGLALASALGVLPTVRVEQPLTFGLVPGLQVLIPVSALVVLAGALHAVSSRRGAGSPGSRSPETDSQEPQGETDGSPGGSSGAFSRVLPRLLLPAVLVLALLRGYLGPVLNEWPFIRGVDHYSHAVMANLMMTEGGISPYLIYPPGFHTMTATVSRLSGLDPLEIFPVLGPALLVLPALSLYALARRLWGAGYGVAAALCSVLLGGTYYYYNDAMYPNLVTSQFLMVLAVAALFALLASPSWRSGFLFALLGSSVVLYHPVASLYTAVLLAVFSLVFVPYLLLRDRRTGVVVFFSLALLGVLAVAYAWDTYDLAREVAGLVGGAGAEEGTTGEAVGMAVGTQPAYEISFLIGTMISQPVAWLGLLGATLLLAARVPGPGTDRTPGRLAPVVPAYFVLFLWALILFLGSRTTQTGFPQRFGRDAGVPLALLAALALVTVLRSLWVASDTRSGTRSGDRAGGGRAAAAFVASLAVLLSVGLVGYRAFQSVESASRPSIQVTITAPIAEAGAWLESHNEGGNVMISPHVNQVPSRMMLAMGDYSALQSFERWQIENPRDLPPTGPGPLEDVLWVLTHPAGPRTGELLREHDVRYLVLYKNMPDRPTFDYWRFFDARPDLYRTAFENADVAIYEPREAAYNDGAAGQQASRRP